MTHNLIPLDTRRLARRLHRGALVVAVAAFLPQVIAQEVSTEYTYDANNQLVRAVDSEGNVLTYEYDFGGNLTGVLRSQVADLAAPTVTSPPATINADETVDLRVNGSNLLLATLAISDPGISVSRYRANDSHVLLSLVVPRETEVGPAQLTFTTGLGAVTFDLNILGPRPVVFSAFPRRSGSTGGALISLRGKNLTPDTDVSFGSSPAAVTFESDTDLQVEVPPGEAGQVVDITASNSNGVTILPGGFAYEFPFAVNGAIAVSLPPAVGSLRIRLREPAVEETTLSIVSADPSLVAVQEALTFEPGESIKEVPVQGIAIGVTSIVTSLGSASLSSAVFVTDPYEGPVELHAASVGGFTLEGALGAEVGVICLPRRLPNIVIASGQSRQFTYPLEAPVGPDGLVLSLAMENPAVAGVPAEVTLVEGETAVPFSFDALTQGVTRLFITGDGVSITIGVYVDTQPTSDGPFLARPAGLFTTPVDGTLAKPAGVFPIPVGETRAAPTGVQVDSP